jgi:hypothetical protein
MVLGIDVSGWQRTISWKAVKKAGVEFGFVKATEGAGYVNPTFERHCEGARRHGITVGAYHFARPDSDDGPIAEADHFLEVAAPRAGDLLPVLDFEHPGLGPRRLARWAKDWLKRVEKRIGQPPILYTYSSFWTSRVDNATGFSRYPLWLANYGVDDGSVHPVRRVGDWPSVAVHQVHVEGPHLRLCGGSRLQQADAGLEARPIPARRRAAPGRGFWAALAADVEGKALHGARRLDAAFLERAAEQAKTRGVATIRGTPREPT